jgi:hypothetical protein
LLPQAAPKERKYGYEIESTSEERQEVESRFGGRKENSGVKGFGLSFHAPGRCGVPDPV